MAVFEFEVACVGVFEADGVHTDLARDGAYQEGDRDSSVPGAADQHDSGVQAVQQLDVDLFWNALREFAVDAERDVVHPDDAERGVEARHLDAGAVGYRLDQVAVG